MAKFELIKKFKGENDLLPKRKTVESAPLSSQMMPYRCFFFYKSAKNCTKFHLINEYLLILHLMKAASPHRREAVPTAHDSIF